METKQKLQHAREDQPHAGDYFVLDTRGDWFYVDAETAARVSRALDRRWLQRWVKFVDLNGARVWLRTRVIEAIRESTERQRARDREFQYLRRKEERVDRRWDDDEC
ncbi:MAG TPA: hypothetical protein VFS20_08490 [Longimicrobium sp.]|nr:hypothetical protein [Longimicrobium sp.]